jgi:hypothetical protein
MLQCPNRHLMGPFGTITPSPWVPPHAIAVRASSSATAKATTAAELSDAPSATSRACGQRRRCAGLGLRHALPFQQPQEPARPFIGQQAVGNEARPGGVDVPVALGVLSMRKKALWDDEVKIILGPRHRNIQQTPLFISSHFRSETGVTTGTLAVISVLDGK